MIYIVYSQIQMHKIHNIKIWNKEVYVTKYWLFNTLNLPAGHLVHENFNISGFIMLACRIQKLVEN